MNKNTYKVLINENEHVTFHELEDLMILIKGLCEKYYNQIKVGLNFTIKEEVEDE